MNQNKTRDSQEQKEPHRPEGQACGRRKFLKGAAAAAALGSTAMLTGCGNNLFGSGEEFSLQWWEFFKKNYRLMTQEEKDQTVQRLERLAKIKRGTDVNISSAGPIEGVLYGYAFNVTRCECK